MSATINADGSLGPFSRSSVRLNVARRNPAIVRLGDRVLVTGGFGTSGNVGSTEVAVVRPDGTLEAFAMATAALDPPRRIPSGIGIDENSFLVVGGRALHASGTGDVNLTQIEGSTLNRTTGQLTPFVSRGTFPIPIHGTTTIALGRYLYTVGGSDGTAVLSAAYRSPIPNGASPAQFTAVQGVNLVVPRAMHGMVVTNTRVYVIGGETGNGALASIEVAALR